jgi:hypothetical protein
MDPVAAVIAAVVLAGFALGALSVTSGIRFARQPGAFRCRVGTSPYSRMRMRYGRRWRLRRTRARWVSDVLIVQSGLLRLGATPMAARVASDTVVRTLCPSEVRGLGKRPATLLLDLEDRAPLEVAVAEASRLLLVGPYLTAGLAGLPRAPRDQGA